jgi:hypothetical protein
MVFNRSGNTAYIGTTKGMLIFDATTNTITATASGITGQVLSVSNDGNTVLVSDVANGKVFVFNNSANAVQDFNVSGVTAADFDADNTKAYLTAGTKVFEFSPNTGTFKTLTFAADGVVFTPQASLAYFGGSSILGLAVCNDARVDNATGAANILGVTPDGTHMIGAGAGGWVDLAYTVNNNGQTGALTACPPMVVSNIANMATGFGAGTSFVGTPTQIAVASNDSFAFLTGFSGGSTATGVPFYHFADQTTGTIQLTHPGTLFSGSVTQDGTSLYVGVGGEVDRIDLTPASGPVDSNQITVSFNPKIVVVRPQ